MSEKFAIKAVLILTALCGLTMGAIAIFGPTPLTPPIAAFFETLKLGFQGGMITIFGLLGSMSVGQTRRLVPSGRKSQR